MSLWTDNEVISRAKLNSKNVVISATEPLTDVVAGMYWVDTSGTDIAVKIRNKANTAFVTILTSLLKYVSSQVPTIDLLPIPTASVDHNNQQGLKFRVESVITADPPAGNVGRLIYRTDLVPKTLKIDDGAAFVKIGGAVSLDVSARTDEKADGGARILENIEIMPDVETVEKSISLTPTVGTNKVYLIAFTSGAGENGINRDITVKIKEGAVIHASRTELGVFSGVVAVDVTLTDVTAALHTYDCANTGSAGFFFRIGAGIGGAVFKVT